jgi:exopolysaccharide production protein ExoZ
MLRRGGRAFGRTVEGAVGDWRQALARVFEADAGARRIRSREGLRGLAVSLVFLVHYESIFGPWLGNGGPNAAVGRFLETVGHSGVDLFFVLSGYLIYGASLKNREGYAKFMERRVRRIYPTFLVILAAYLVLSLLLPSESKLPPGRGAAIAYVVENVLLLPGMLRITPIVSVAWSLSYELFYYLVIPLVVGALGLRLWPASRRVALFVALSAGFAICCFFGAEHVQLILFASGIVVYEASRSARVQRLAGYRLAQPVALAVLAAFLPVCYALLNARGSWLPAAVSARYTLQACWLFAALFVVTLCAFVAEGPVRSLFSLTPLRWLGNMSYSYYLVHVLTLKALAMAVSRGLPGWKPGAAAHWALLPCAFAATLASSTVLFLLVERRYSLTPQRSAVAAVPFGASIAKS